MVWFGLSSFFTTLTYNQQRALHDYYLPTKELSDEQLLAHRAKMAADQPSLASVAGKAFRQIERTYLEVTRGSGGDPVRLRALLDSHVHYTSATTVRKGVRIRVTGLARPEIDVRMAARAFIEMGKQLAAEERAAKAEAETEAHDDAA